MTLMVSWPVLTDDTGTGQDGTPVDHTFEAAVKASIEDQVHSTTNILIKPKATTDEVVTARGNKATLSARLSSVIDSDGALIVPSDLTTDTEVGTFQGSHNLARNANFDRWNNGIAVAPDEWTLVSLTAAQNIGQLTMGPYSAKLTRAAGVDGYMYQRIRLLSEQMAGFGGADASSFQALAGQVLTVQVLCKASVANQCRIMLDCVTATGVSAYHTGGGTAEKLTASVTIPAGYSDLQVKLQVLNTNGDVYFGGVIVVLSSVAPSYLQARSDEPNQTHLVLNSQYTVVGNVGAGEDDLMTYTMLANMLAWNGRGVRITMWGQGANNANAKTLKAYFGGTQVSSSFALVINQLQAWKIVIEVIRTGASAQEVHCKVDAVDNNAITNPTGSQRVQTLAIDTTADIIIKLTGTGTNNNDITQRGMIVERIGV